MSRRDSKVVVITGASAGVGRATAREFAKHGARIALLARGQDGLEKARAEVEQLGGEALVLPTDVSDYEQVEAAAAQTEGAFGPIDCWINCAMVSVFAPVKKMLPEEYRRVTEVTYLGYVHGTLAALKRMLPRDEGLIIQVGSALAYRGIPLQSAYCASKHAIQGFMDSLRCELLHDKSNVRATMIDLPAVNTTQFTWVRNKMAGKPQPVPPIYEPEVIARAIYWLSRHDRREVYVGFPTVKAIVGNKIAPNFADHYLARNGYSAQLLEEPDDPDRPDNLWTPVPGDHGAHGPFDNRSRRFSPQFWVTEHRKGLALAGLGLLAAVVRLATKERNGHAEEAPPLEETGVVGETAVVEGMPAPEEEPVVCSPRSAAADAGTM